MSEIKEKVMGMLEQAEIQATGFFDICMVAMARLEGGGLLTALYMCAPGETFDREQGMQDCMQQFYDQLAAMEEVKASPAPVLTAEEAEVIVALAAEDMKMTRAAEKLGCGKAAVSRHVKNIHTRTGLDPLTFYGMVELLMAASAVLEAKEE